MSHAPVSELAANAQQSDGSIAKHFVARMGQSAIDAVEHCVAAGQCASPEAAEVLLALRPSLAHSSWLSYELLREVLELAAEALGGADQLSSVPANIVGLGYAADITERVRACGSPEGFYRSMGNLRSLSSLLTIETHELGPREWEVSVAVDEDYEPFPELCAWQAGRLIAATMTFGYPRAHIEHLECQCHGAAACRLRVTWEDADQQLRDHRVTELRMSALQYRLDEFQDVVADVVAGESVSEVLTDIVRIAVRVALGCPCVLVVTSDTAGAERTLYADGLDAETASLLAEELCDDSPSIDPRRLVLEARFGGKLYGYMAIIDESMQLVSNPPKLLQTYARLAASVLANERMVDQIRHDALHDGLTGLANRALIIDRLEQMLARNHRGGAFSAVLFIDLDGFKQVNDTFGHEAGDAVLRAVATRLGATVRQADTVGRLGGDEFVMLLDGATLSVGPELVAERLLAVLAEPFDLGELSASPVLVTASVGISKIGDSAREMLRDADLALYRAKQQGKNRHMTFAPEMQTAAKNQLLMEMDLRSALDSHQFQLEYQPIFTLATGKVKAVEALLRWHHPDRGIVQPDEFIPVLEDTGLIVPVGRWVLMEACAEAIRTRAQGHELTVTVNVSIRQLESPDFEQHVHEALQRTGLEPRCLTLEVTETALMHDVQTVVPTLVRLRDLGVKVAIDDFGTGYSSLAYLQQLPIDTLKIDRSFITGLSASSDSATLVRTLVRLGKDLGLETLAEGIEEGEQYAALQLEQCDSGQGYMFARPLPSAELHRFLNDHDSASLHPRARAIGPAEALPRT